VGEHLLLAATDRISAYDWVLPSGIPGKGVLLTQLSVFWFEKVRSIVANHLITSDVSRMGKELQPYREQLEGRSMLVRKARMVPVECIVRGYLAGSGWQEYCEEGTVGGLPVPQGLRCGDRLPEPLFTPTTKAQEGHDEPISFEEVARQVGGDTAEILRRKSVEVYRQACRIAEPCGVLLADTKLEWGWVDGELVLADELLTPDSSRFWPSEDYRPGREQPSFDKQFVRDYLSSTGWDRNSPPPPLPAEIVERTAQRYREAYRRLVGTPALLNRNESGG
jgi:phosphoribosylaminoimidazole-succinocarboxamide synthase